MHHDLVPLAQIGDVDTPALPHPVAARLGRARLLAPTGPVVARAHTTVVIEVTAGMYGVDDSGAVKLALRFPFDGGGLQDHDPTAPNYVTAVASRPGVRLVFSYTRKNPRPWFKAAVWHVTEGCLRPGDTVRIVLGDTSGGSPGLRMQTFCEDHLELRVLLDPIATGHFAPLADRLAIQVIPGPPHAFKAVLPTLRRPGEAFSLGLKAEDRWGNPTPDVRGPLRLVPSMPVRGLPDAVDWPEGARAVRLADLSCADPGALRIDVVGPDGRLCTSNPLRVDASAAVPSFWADLHGQSAETVGVNTARRYFAFARDLAFLDASSHQGNDFQIRDSFWDELNALTAELDTPGVFLALPGYEWSGNTGVGGDRNVFFRHEGRAIRRSSHALLTDRSDLDGDCPTAGELFAALRDQDAVAYAHVGGRYADLEVAHDGHVETSVELHSAWGSFPWLLHDAFRLGHRVGVVANSDGHKGRPGASYPGAATFGAMGGLTCFLMPELTRDALFAALRARRHYATSGARLHLDVRVDVPGERFDTDPALGPATSQPVAEAQMGDIVRTDAAAVQVRFQVDAAAPIGRVEVCVADAVVHTHIPFRDPRGRVRLQWEGARYRGRGREVIWDGDALVAGTTLLRAEKLDDFNPERALVRDGQALSWRAVTTGNHGGVDLWLDDDRAGTIDVRTGPVTATIDLATLGDERVFDAGGLERRLRVVRLPADDPPTTTAGAVTVDVRDTGDTPVWVTVWLLDGHRAWSSPVYLFRENGDASDPG